MPDAPILVINTGSSSLKLGLYAEREGQEHLLFDGLADGIGRSSGTLTMRDANGQLLRSEILTSTSQHEALREAVQWLTELSPGMPCAIGHRVVHGGPRLTTHQRITPEVLEQLRQCVHFAPLHIPMALQLIEEAQSAYPQIPEFACFDTAFHRTMPEAASRFALPRALYEQGIRRYGFHGLSYESIVYKLGEEQLGEEQLGNGLPARTVIAHLGSGASLAAVRNGRSVDTSMGLTPTGGIPMATRTGDLDPGVILYLLRQEHAAGDSTVDSVVDLMEALLNHDSGLKALSGGKADVRDLEAAADAGDSEAQLALEVFCGRIAQTVAAYTAVLGGLDLLVFAGGVGEHSARVRGAVCGALGFLGVTLDQASNQSHAATISTAGSKVRVRIVASEEDRQIARHCRALLGSAASRC
ncbi:MAG TPA: acetate/propionate family kinase [Granulicella sp.]|nr:acetate/propionate family kinase [Granulicella sp.]